MLSAAGAYADELAPRPLQAPEERNLKAGDYFNLKTAVG
jgi:hypothetical protein